MEKGIEDSELCAAGSEGAEGEDVELGEKPISISNNWVIPLIQNRTQDF